MTEEEEHFKLCTSSTSTSSSSSTYSISSVNQSIRINLSQEVVQYILLCIGHTMPSTSNSTSGTHIPLPDVTRALAIITLGKCCMRSKALSRHNLNILLREIQLPDSNNYNHNQLSKKSNTTSNNTATSHSHTSTAATRGNALIVLGDMCIRYTNVIEGHISTISVCLQDPETRIRKEAFILFIQVCVVCIYMYV